MSKQFTIRVRPAMATDAAQLAVLCEQLGYCAMETEVGSRLMCFLVRYEILCVPCNIIRAEAHRFYEREGFREIKVQRIFERRVHRFSDQK